MRTIDADALKDPLELQRASYARIGATERAIAYADCLREIAQAPTVGGWISNQEIVRCKDCIYRPTAVKGKYRTEYVFPHEGKCPCQCYDDWYSWMPDDDWFCADGERR